MPGLVPGIHVFASLLGKNDVDGRDEPGHDERPRDPLCPAYESCSMEYAPENLKPRERYKLLAGFVLPRPIG